MSYDTGAARKAEQRRDAQDISNGKYYEAIVKGPESLDRRLEAAASFKLFCQTYGSSAFTLTFADFHNEVIEKFEDAVFNHSSLSVALPRGSGKSTLCQYGMVWAALCGHSPYNIFIAANVSQSLNRLSSIKSSLRFNEDLYKDFPEILGPIRSCGGESRKASGQRFNGETTELVWNAQRIVFPTLHGFEDQASWYKNVNYNFGTILDFASMESGLRGKSVERPDGTVQRPTLAVCDDIQTRESAASPAQVRKREQILQGDIAYLGSPERPCGIIAPITVVHEDDLADRMLDHEIMPEFRGVRYGALNHLPWEECDLPEQEEKLIDLWENQYSELRRFDLLDMTDHATAFYKANKAEMDAKCVATWPERYNPDELSAIQNCLNLYLRNPEAFAAEYMNAPKAAQASLKPKLVTSDIEARSINVDRNVAPAGCDLVTLSIDVSKSCLWWSLMAIDKASYRAHVMDAGVWPPQGKPYVTLSGVKKTIHDRNPNDEYSVALMKGLADFVDEMLMKDLVNESGNPVHIDGISIDSGWGSETDTVMQFCRRHAQARMLYAFKGFGSSPTKAPLVNPEKPQKGPHSLVGQWKATRNEYGASSIIFDTNAWKTRVDDALRLPVESTSSLTIFGGRENGRTPNLRMLCEQLTAEEGILVEAQGRSIEQWRIRGVGSDNHLFDTIVGNYLLANIRGAEIRTTGKTGSLNPIKKSKKRRRYRAE